MVATEDERTTKAGAAVTSCAYTDYASNANRKPAV